MDRPHNLLPSLHIALACILAVLYARHTSGFVRFASNIWFALIVLSALLTYQHHFIDIIGGFILAALCFYLVPDWVVQFPVTPNPRIGIYYLVGAATLAAAAGWLRPWGLLLFWPAFAIGMVASSYFGLGPRIYRKRDGRLPWSARILLAPTLLGQHLSLLHYRRECRAWDEASPGVWIGRRLDAVEAAGAKQAGVIAVLDLTAEFSEAPAFLGPSYHSLPVLDLTAPTPAQLREAVAFIDAHVGKGIVYVHCKIGYSRSAAVVGAWLVSSGRAADAGAALARLRAVRPTIVVRPEAETALREFAATLARRTGA